MNDANIAACQRTPEGGCAWKGEAVGSNPGYVEPVPPAAPKLTPADIEAVVVHEQYFTAADGVFGAAQKDGLAFAAFRGPEGLDRVTFCVLTLRNGAKVTGINHGPVSAANFSADKGRQYARESAIEKVWELEGYLLRERLAVEAAKRARIAHAQEVQTDLLRIEKWRGLALARDGDGRTVEAVRAEAIAEEREACARIVEAPHWKTIVKNELVRRAELIRGR